MLLESTSALTLLISSMFIYITGRVIYNLVLHPLAKFDGPMSWKAFRFPFIKAMITGGLPQRVKVLHEKYGPIVRVAPDELSFTDPAAWRDIYLQNFVRPYEYKDKPPGKAAENLISASEPDHARFRKLPLGCN